MRPRRTDRHRRIRFLGVALLILGVGNVPWPRADFHNLRHHHGPGEVCALHEHLLRWHADARLAEDVAVLHWHWVPPTAPVPDSGGEPGARARVQDWMAPSWDDAPRLAPASAPRLIDRPASGPTLMVLLVPETREAATAPRAGPGRARAFGATFAPRVPLTALLQRWTC